jgi:hypothetical protein
LIKNFLASVLTLAVLGLPAWASVAEYCSGTNCGASTQTAFNTAVTAAGGVFGGPNTFVDSAPALIYTDSTTGIIFEDFPGANDLTVSAGTLSTMFGNDDSIVVVIPSTILAINLTINVTKGLCGDFCGEGETSGFLGFINPDSPTSPWSVTISPLQGGGSTQILDFNAASAQMNNSDTPEIGTLLLIGTGLIVMRWMRRARRRTFQTPQTA